MTETKQRARHIPFGRTVSLWIELSGDLAKLGENLVYDVLEFVQSLWAHLRDVVHHNHWVYTVSLLGLLPQDVTKELWRDKGEMIMEGNHNLSHLSGCRSRGFKIHFDALASLNSNWNETHDYQINFHWGFCQPWRVAEWNTNRKHGERKERVRAVKDFSWTWTKHVAGIYEPLLTRPWVTYQEQFLDIYMCIYSSPHQQYCWYAVKIAMAWIF